MKLKNPLLAVRDMERSKAFYREVLGLHVVMDFGANVTLTGGLCLQTLETWAEFLGKEADEVRFGGDDSEVYFEEDDETETYKIVTTVRGNSLKGLISSESPLGKALLGHKLGDRVHVQVNETSGYDVIIKRIEKTVDDGSDALRSF